jgi:hypothetical protein
MLPPLLLQSTVGGQLPTLAVIAGNPTLVS